MKKRIIYLSFLSLLLTVLSVSLVNAKKSDQPKVIKYDLAYPGMLPNNPLYKLKVLRDRISIALISDPQKKIDFYLLQTDKGILATAMLVDYKKMDLAESTALKAEHNYTLLVNELKKLQKKPSADVFQKLKIASSKHQEVLNSIIKKLPAEKQEILKTVLDFSKRNLKTVEIIEKRNPKTWTDWDNVKLE